MMVILGETAAFKTFIDVILDLVQFLIQITARLKAYLFTLGYL